MTRMPRRLVALAVLATTIAATAHAQSVDDIVERHLKALGGRAALEKLTSRSMTGTIAVATPGGEVTGDVEIYNTRPNKSRTLITIDLSAFQLGRLVMDQRFDGATGYVIDTMQGNRDITGDLLEGMKNGVFPTMMLDYKPRGIGVELTGREKIRDREAFVLVMKPATGPAVRVYVDAESYLPLRQAVNVNVPQLGDVEQVTDFLEYGQFDGFSVPIRVANSTAAQSTAVTITKVEHNAPLDPAMFVKPADAK